MTERSPNKVISLYVYLYYSVHVLIMGILSTFNKDFLCFRITNKFPMSSK